MDKLKIWELLVEACAETLRDHIDDSDYDAIKALEDYDNHQDEFLEDVIYSVSDDYIDYADVAGYVNDRTHRGLLSEHQLQNELIGELIDELELDINAKGLA
jgi:hypothetical protein